MLTSIVVTPSPKTIDKGKTQVFTATGYDQNNNVITISPAPTWSVTGGIGTVSPSSGSSTTFTATTAGTGTVVATSGTVSGHAQVTVQQNKPIPWSIDFDKVPDLTLSTWYSEPIYVIAVRDQYGDQIPVENCSFSWVITSNLANIGNAIKTGINGMYYKLKSGIPHIGSNIVGNFHVTVTYNGESISTGGQITVPACKVVDFRITADKYTVIVDSSLNLTAYGICQYTLHNDHTNFSLHWLKEGSFNGYFSSAYGRTNTFTAKRVGTGNIYGSLNGGVYWGSDNSFKVEPRIGTVTKIINPGGLGQYWDDKNRLDITINTGDIREDDSVYGSIIENATITTVDIADLNIWHQEISRARIFLQDLHYAKVFYIWNEAYGDPNVLSSYSMFGLNQWYGLPAANLPFNLVGVQNGNNLLRTINGRFHYLKLVVHWQKLFQPGY